MPANLLIIGAGGFGRELYAASLECRGCGSDFVPCGFLDARAGALDGFSGYPPVLGSPETYAPRGNDVFAVALGSVEARRRCAETLSAKGARFIALVHGRANVGFNVEIGPGSYIAPGVSLTADVRIGAHVDVFHNTSVGHDTVIGDFAHIYAQCAIGGGGKVGKGARIFPGSTIVPRIKIGDGATVGAGSAVFLDVRDGETVMGNPAAPIE